MYQKYNEYEKLIELHMHSIDDFYNSLMFDGNVFGNVDQYIFRGESSAKYTLIPYSFRENGRELLLNIYNNRDSYKGFEELIYIEAHCVWSYYIKSNQFGIRLPHIRIPAPGDYAMPYNLVNNFWEEKYLEIFALAQHYGIPTRLLDWTTDVCVALFFAASGALNKISEGKESTDRNEFVIWMLKHEHALFCSHRIFCAVPQYSTNPYICAQKGIMTYTNQLFKDKGETKIKPFDDIIRESRYYRLNDRNQKIALQLPVMYKICFPYSEAKRTCDFLYRNGYSHARIFPGLQGVAMDMVNPMSVNPGRPRPPFYKN